MFVLSPPLKTNGSAIVRVPLVINENKVFTTASAALAHKPTTGVVNTGWKGGRTRDKMGKGVTSNKKGFKPTSYYSFAGQFTSLAVTTTVNKYDPGSNRPLEFHSVSREFGWGYTGGGGSGIGRPELLFRRGDTSSGDARAVLNRAIIANLESRARSEIMVKARNNKMSLGESLAELPKTVALVAGTVYRLYYAFRHVERGDISKALEALKIKHLRDRRGRLVEKATTAEGKWLALRYGWLPLAYDIYNGVNLVNEGLKNPLGTFTVSRKVNGELPFFGHLWNLNDNPWQNVRISHFTSCDVQYKYRLRVKDALTAYLTSLGLENPLYVAWQVLPYSFVLDWAIPVSDWLSALSAPIGLTFVDGYRTTHIEHVSHWSAGPYGISQSDDRILHFSGPALGELRCVEVDREALSAFPIVQPYVRLPSLSPTRIADAIALIKERKRR